MVTITPTFRSLGRIMKETAKRKNFKKLFLVTVRKIITSFKFSRGFDLEVDNIKLKVVFFRPPQTDDARLVGCNKQYQS